MATPALDLIEARARALHSAYVGIYPTREIHRWFDRLFAAIAEARGVAAPVVNPSAPPVDVHATPAPDANHVPCPRCLSRRADRGHVEQHGVCLDCALGGHATKGPTVKRDHEPSPSLLTAEREPPRHADGDSP